MEMIRRDTDRNKDFMTDRSWGMLGGHTQRGQEGQNMVRDRGTHKPRPFGEFRVLFK